MRVICKISEQQYSPFLEKSEQLRVRENINYVVNSGYYVLPVMHALQSDQKEDKLELSSSKLKSSSARWNKIQVSGLHIPILCTYKYYL